jgi:hypothetical protein
MKKLLLAVLTSLVLASGLSAQTIAVDAATYAPSWPAGQRNIPFAFDKDTGKLLTSGSGGGGGGGGGSTTFGSPQSIRLSDGTQWLQAALDRTTAAAPSAFRLTDGTNFYDARNVRALTASDVVSINGTVPVSGTFYQATQPVSAAALPLPAGAATESTLASLNGKIPASPATEGGNLATIASNTGRIPAQGGAASSGSLPVVLSRKDIVGAFTAQATGNNLLTSDGTWLDAQGYNSFSVQIIGSAGISAGAVIFEQTNDTTLAANGIALAVDEQGVINANPQTSAITIAASTVRAFKGALLMRYIRVRISTSFVGGTVQAVGTFSTLPYAAVTINAQQATAASLATTATIASGTVTTVTTLTGTTTLTPGTGAANLGKAEDAVAASGDTGLFVLGVRRDVATQSASATGDYGEIATAQFGDVYTSKLGTRKRSYSAAFTVVPAASATDVVEIIGSATTTVEITRITIGGVQTTAGQVLTNFIRRSTAATAGTSTNATMVPHQATDAAATAVCKIYTANPTTGTLVGTIRSRRLPIGQSTSLIAPTEFSFGENTKPIFLAGVAQTLCINLNGATVTGGSLDVEIEFTEF